MVFESRDIMIGYLWVGPMKLKGNKDQFKTPEQSQKFSCPNYECGICSLAVVCKEKSEVLVDRKHNTARIYFGLPWSLALQGQYLQ